MKKAIIATFFVLIIAVLAVYVYTFKKPARTAASEDALFSLSVKELTTEFESNENTANAKYLNKVVQVFGTVETISESENEISITLKDPGSIAGVTCSFDKSEMDKNRVKAGQEISIKGICSGFLMDVVLNKCALVTGSAK